MGVISISFVSSRLGIGTMRPLLLILVVLIALIGVDAFCCNWVLTSDMKAQCEDGSYVHPWQCCTTGSCNVFCCNCDQPCLSNGTNPKLLTQRNTAKHRETQRNTEKHRETQRTQRNTEKHRETQRNTEKH